LKVFQTKKTLQAYLNESRALNKKIGLVPTMGALHPGHTSLIAQAKHVNDIVVCSIFVNPTQFNDPKDLEKYPRTLEADIALLEDVDCDVLFNPSVEEIYHNNEKWHLDIGSLEYILEGKFRPGHYQGVMQVVYKLFDIVKPVNAYFGQKDYQQFLVIAKMVDLTGMEVKLTMCPIVRESDGLAMSSRNRHLSAYDHELAIVLSRTLNWVKENFYKKSIDALLEEAKVRIGSNPNIVFEYFEIVDGLTLNQVTPQTEKIVALVAAKVGNTRLIDNILIKI
jgi:pantoate--beta-alanine ligase